MPDAAALLNRAGTSAPSAQASALLSQMTEDGWSHTSEAALMGDAAALQQLTSVPALRGFAARNIAMHMQEDLVAAAADNHTPVNDAASRYRLDAGGVPGLFSGFN